MDYIKALISSFGLFDALDVAIVAFAIYHILSFVRETRAEQLGKGILVVLIAKVLAEALELYTINWILGYIIDMGAIALVIIFQPELRRALEYLGRNKFLPQKQGKVDKTGVQSLISTLVETADEFSKNRVGALMILERQTSLTDIAETGTYLNADVSKELLGNVFYEGAPLHDGAVILRSGRILSAGCVLPLTQNQNLSKDLGTRHRAGIGVSEVSDAISLIVSEESGIISIAVDGRLSRFLDLKSVERTLTKLYLTNMDAQSGNWLDGLKKVFRKGGFHGTK
ncbi:MAG: diadenylate cyclase CdaA [Firmicutes bacterium]|jgi:diadenylate cyclase|nr:diadenylate cyclase CdaA [Bacillota bacterium]MBQ5797827.1 diadenylate cyclase CdaA [Bacillota bacterium]MBR5001137.1 diadenylate cyclase CdaA [Bacillota bacterium]